MQNSVNWKVQYKLNLPFLVSQILRDKFLGFPWKGCYKLIQLGKTKDVDFKYSRNTISFVFVLK